MTPAVLAAKAAAVTFELLSYQHDPAAASYGLEAAEKLGLQPELVYKTLVCQLDNRQLVVALVPVQQQLDLKALARHFGQKKADMADKLLVERQTGYVLGGVSPLGQKKRLPTVIDLSADGQRCIYVSAGRRGLELALAAKDLATLCQASFVAVAK